MAVTIKLRQGLGANLAAVNDTIAGELMYVTDDIEVYVSSDASTRHRMSMDKDWGASSFRYASTGGTPIDKTATEVMALLHNTAGADFSLNDNKITNIKAPTANADAATKLYVDDLVAAGIHWIKAVLDTTVLAEPGAPSTGDRYYVDGVASGTNWGTGAADNKLAVWNGTTWELTGLVEGDAFYDDANNEFYFCDVTGTSIALFSSGMGAHAASHTDGTDDIQSATNAQKGLATSTHITNLETVISDLSSHTGSGGAAHANVIASGNAGFMTGADKALLDAVPAGGTLVVDGDFASDGILKRTAAGVYGIVTDNSGNWNTAHGWGDHAGLYTLIAHDGAGGAAHAVAISGGANGFFAGTDKALLDAIPAGNTILVDGDFASAGIMETNGSGTYSIATLIDGGTF